MHLKCVYIGLFFICIRVLVLREGERARGCSACHSLSLSCFLVGMKRHSNRSVLLVVVVDAGSVGGAVAVDFSVV